MTAAPSRPATRVRASWTRWLWPAGLLLVVGLHFWFPPLGASSPNDTFSVGVNGKKAFFLLIRSQSRSTTRNLRPLEAFAHSDETATLCLLGPAREPTADEWDSLLDWVARGGALVYATSFDVFDRTLVHGESRVESIRIPDLDVELLPAMVGFDATTDVEVTSPLADDRGELVWDSRAAIEAPGSRSLLMVEGIVQAVRVPYGRGRVVVVATDESFSNRELVVGDGGVFGHRLLEAASPGGRLDDVVFDESLNVSATPKVVGLLFDPTLRPLTIQLLVVTFTFAWWGRERFGPSLPPATSAQQDVVGHSDALGTLIHQSGDGAGALRTYYEQLAAELGLGRGTEGRLHHVLGPVARRLGVEVDRVREVIHEAAAASERKRLSRVDAARHIRRLARIRRASRRRATEESS